MVIRLSMATTIMIGRIVDAQWDKPEFMTAGLILETTLDNHVESENPAPAQS
jgi:hypothetical protein